MSDAQNDKEDEPKGYKAFDYISSTLILFAAAIGGAITNKKTSSDEEKNATAEIANWTRVVGVWTRGLVFVGVCTVAVIALQTFILYNQLNEMKADQRPVLWTGTNVGTPMFYLNPQTGQGQIYWTVHFANYGRGFTKSGTAKTFIKLGDHNFQQSYGQPKFDTLAPIAPNQDMFLTAISEPGTTPDEFAALAKRENGFSVKFEIAYLDLAGQTFETAFCLTKLLSGAIKYCPTGNYVK